MCLSQSRAGHVFSSPWNRELNPPTSMGLPPAAPPPAHGVVPASLRNVREFEGDSFRVFRSDADILEISQVVPSLPDRHLGFLRSAFRRSLTPSPTPWFSYSCTISGRAWSPPGTELRIRRVFPAGLETQPRSHSAFAAGVALGDSRQSIYLHCTFVVRGRDLLYPTHVACVGRYGGQSEKDS